MDRVAQPKFLVRQYLAAVGVENYILGGAEKSDGQAEPGDAPDLCVGSKKPRAGDAANNKIWVANIQLRRRPNVWAKE